MDTEKYSFMQETIKEETTNPRKVCKRILTKILYGAIFGFAACIGFYIMRPWAESVFTKEKTTVEISQVEEDETEEEQTEEIELPTMSISQYKELSKALYDVAVQAKKSVVCIEGMYNPENVLDYIDNIMCRTTGLIVADKGNEILLLANYSSMRDAAEYRIRFSDDSTCSASLKQKDVNLDIAIFSFSKLGLSDTIKNQMEVVKFGNAGVLQAGTSIIAIGQPFGYVDGVGYGTVSSTKERLRLADGAYGIFTLDMPASENGNGFLFDTNGNVMGFINTSLSEKFGSEMMTAYKISEIKTQMELLLNGKSLPYIGVVAIDVSEDLTQTQGIPEGIYVKEVEKNSPAMQSGIQSGDVVVALNNETVTDLSSFQTILSQLSVDQKVSCKVMRRGSEAYVEVELQITVGNK